MKKVVNGISVPMSKAEIKKFKEAEKRHEKQLLADKATDYQRLRLLEYPAISDLIVALVEKEEGRPEALHSLIMQRLQIKNKYPKP